MKRMKKILSVLLSVVMVLAMGVTAFAEDDEPSAAGSNSYSVTITKATGKYAIYQVFTGDYDGTKLSNVMWGAGVTEFNYTIGNGKTSDKASEIAEYLASKKNDESVAKDFAKKAIVNKTNATATAEAGSDGKATFTNLAPGYYVVENTKVASDKSYTQYILQVVGNVTVENKADVPSLEKKVADINDSENDKAGAWHDSADYDIGDAVPFELTGTVAANYDAYDTYYFAFHDQEEAGLTFDESSVEVKVGNTVIPTENYTIKTKTSDAADKKPEDDCTFEIIFRDLKKLADATGQPLVSAGSKITVTYTSTLNNNAVLGDQGNVNKAKLEFSNNPNNTQGGDHGTTPWDNVIVFTYKVVVNKVDQDQHALKGAEFTLTKKVKDKQDATIAVVKSNEGTTFTFNGLDDGEYTLTETVTPKGFNTIDPITFKVSANHKITWTTEDRKDILTSLKGEKVSGEISLTSDKTEGSLTANVVNKQGSLLPSTGGIGTTIFYVVGAVLMIGAGVILVSRRRTNK